MNTNLHPTHQRLIDGDPVSHDDVQSFLADTESTASAEGALQAFPLPQELGAGELRTVLIDAEPWFVAADLAAVLGYSHTPSMVRGLDDDEKGVHSVHTPGGYQQVTIVNESGLYSLILCSRRPEARGFKRWVTHEVLPQIRVGGPSAAGQADAMHEHLGAALGGRIGLAPAPAQPAAAAGVLHTLLGALLPLLLPLLPALLQAVTAWLNRQAQPAAPRLPDYMAEPWFLILQALCMEYPRADVARTLGVSAPFISQVLNGSGKYGRGEASTHKLAQRVLNRFANVGRNRLPADQHRPRRTTVTVEQH